jgi:hypothetical protein
VLGFDASQDTQPLVQTWPSIRIDAGTIRLIKGGFEDEWEARPLGRRFDTSRSVQGRFLIFDYIEACDENQWRTLTK